MLKKALKHVEDRLYHWSDWSLKYHDGIGYQSESLIEKMRRFGGHLDLKPGQRILMIEDRDAEEMEVLIRELRVYKPLMADVICEQYLARGTVKQKAKRLKICYRTYMLELKLAKYWLAGRLVRLKISGD